MRITRQIPAPTTLPHPHVPLVAIVDFSDDDAIVSVSTHLRLAWTELPPPLPPAPDSIAADADSNADDAAAARKSHENLVQQTVFHNIRLSSSERAGDAQVNSDAGETSAWRDVLARAWNNVWADVLGYLPDAIGETEAGRGKEVGHFWADTHRYWGVKAGVNERAGGADGKKGRVVRAWDQNVVVSFTWLKKGWRVVGFVNEDEDEAGGERKEVGRLGNEQGGKEVWFVRKGVEVEFVVEREDEEDDEEAGEEGTIAVVVTGYACTLDHDRMRREQSEVVKKGPVASSVVQALGIVDKWADEDLI